MGKTMRIKEKMTKKNLIMSIKKKELTWNQLIYLIVMNTITKGGSTTMKLMKMKTVNLMTTKKTLRQVQLKKRETL